jgi:hypothetical protein
LISDWDDETVLRVEMLDSPPNTVLISGNRAGLTSLAQHLLTLTQAKAQRGAHLDFGEVFGVVRGGFRRRQDRTRVIPSRGGLLLVSSVGNGFVLQQLRGTRW